MTGNFCQSDGWPSQVCEFVSLSVFTMSRIKTAEPSVVRFSSIEALETSVGDSDWWRA